MDKLRSKLSKLTWKRKKKNTEPEEPNEVVKRTLENSYQLSKVVLGKGAFGSVVRAKNRETGELVAVKIQEKGEELAEIMLDEVRLQEKFSNPHVVRIFDVFETDENIYIVQELMEGGELYDIIAEANEISEAQASQVMKEILLGVRHLHNRGVVHRDIKPENILCTSKDWPLRIKLADFGFASALDCDGETINKEFVGSPDYVAPEIVRNKSHGKEVDMWSCGVVLYVLLSGALPFGRARDTDTKLRYVARGRYDFPEEYWGNISDSALSLVSGLMQKDPKKRLTAESALLHDFIDKPELLKRTPTGNDMSGISSKFRKAIVTVLTTNKMKMLLNKN